MALRLINILAQGYATTAACCQAEYSALHTRPAPALHRVIAPTTRLERVVGAFQVRLPCLVI